MPAYYYDVIDAPSVQPPAEHNLLINMEVLLLT
jgi:hypothetical protein